MEEEEEYTFCQIHSRQFGYRDRRGGTPTDRTVKRRAAIAEVMAEAARFSSMTNFRLRGQRRRKGKRGEEREAQI